MYTTHRLRSTSNRDVSLAEPDSLQKMLSPGQIFHLPPILLTAWLIAILSNGRTTSGCPSNSTHVNTARKYETVRWYSTPDAGALSLQILFVHRVSLWSAEIETRKGKETRESCRHNYLSDTTQVNLATRTGKKLYTRANRRHLYKGPTARCYHLIDVLQLNKKQIYRVLCLYRRVCLYIVNYILYLLHRYLLSRLSYVCTRTNTRNRPTDIFLARMNKESYSSEIPRSKYGNTRFISNLLRNKF